MSYEKKRFDLKKFCEENVVEIFEQYRATDNKYKIKKLMNRFDRLVHKALNKECPRKREKKKKKEEVEIKGVKVFDKYRNILEPKHSTRIPFDMLDLLKKRHEEKLKQAKTKKQIDDIKRQGVLLELIGFGYSRSEAQRVMKKIFGMGFSATTFKNLRQEYKDLSIQVEEYMRVVEVVRKPPTKPVIYGQYLISLDRYAKYLTRSIEQDISTKESICIAFSALIARECALRRGEPLPEWIEVET